MKSIIAQCAPTLAGIKTGNLFYVEKCNANCEIREINKILRQKGVQAIPLRAKNNRTLVYVFRPDMLKKDLSDPNAKQILKERGYTCENVNKCLLQLIHNIANTISFPHEIGLFLGYPPSDVRAFINDPINGVQCVGCWKAYSDKEKAEATFKKFKKCSECYLRAYKNGKTLSQLTVQTQF